MLGLTFVLVLLELGVLLMLLLVLGCSPVLIPPPCSCLHPTNANAAQKIRIVFFMVDSFSLYVTIPFDA